MESTIAVSENAIINILKDIPENILADIFWKTLVSNDDTPLSESENRSIIKAKEEFKKGETIRWQDIK